MIEALKIAAIKTALSAITWSGAGRLFPSAKGRGAIFMMHHVRPKKPRKFDPNAHLEVTPEFLETVILAAKAEGYKPVPLSELPGLLRRGNPSDRYCAFTLDDGYRNNAEFAAPVFRKHGVPYTIFICTGFAERTRIAWWEAAADVIEKADAIRCDFGAGTEQVSTRSNREKAQAFQRIEHMIETVDEDTAVARVEALAREHDIEPMDFNRREIMTDDEISNLAKDPLCSFGGHTLTHCNLARIDDNRLKREIRESAARIMDWTGATIDTFAYPYGKEFAACQREFMTVSAEGFVAAVTTRPGLLHSDMNPTGLPRVSLNGHYQKRRYLEALFSGLPFAFSWMMRHPAALNKPASPM